MEEKDWFGLFIVIFQALPATMPEDTFFWQLCVLMHRAEKACHLSDAAVSQLRCRWGAGETRGMMEGLDGGAEGFASAKAPQ